MRRLAVVLSVVLAACVGPAQFAVSASSPASALQDPALQGDFNGDGFADLAVGVPGEDVGAAVDAGAVNVLYDTVGFGNWSGVGSQLFTQSGAGGSASAGDRFGAAIVAGNFNGDGFGDLAMGAPGENVGAVGDAGAVSVLYGSADGLTGSGAQLFTQDSPDVGSSAEPGDRFGAALAAADFNGDGFADLAVGVPGEVGNVRAGAVTVLYGAAAGLSGIGSQLFTQNSPDVPGTSEAGDRFGQALAAADFHPNGFAELAVGAPGEDVSAVVDAGAVTLLGGQAAGLSGVGSQLFTQGSPGIGGNAERGDGFGFALAANVGIEPASVGLAIGVPREDVFNKTDAGAVVWLFGHFGGRFSRTLTQDHVGSGTSAEPGDLFGYALALGDFGGGDLDLAIGVPGEDVFDIVDAGMVNVVYNRPFPPADFYRRITQAHLGAGPEQGDRYGSTLTVSRAFPSGGFVVAIAAPGEDINAPTGTVADAGMVSAATSTGNHGLTPVSIALTQNSPGVGSSAEPGDLFGGALATSSH